MVNNTKITLKDKISQCEGNIVSDMNGEKVMLSIQNGKYYNLGEIGGEIWDMIEKPIFVSELINNLLSMYEVNQEECEVQVISLLEHLLEENLIRVKEQVA